MRIEIAHLQGVIATNNPVDDDQVPGEFGCGIDARRDLVNAARRLRRAHCNNGRRSTVGPHQHVSSGDEFGGPLEQSRGGQTGLYGAALS